ncbi:unnamed protein product [Cyprideis torosa]|uniref:Uncharacterized protein n=1 Tax=Cyprideis torosa TaxID=163714 RepID=A0A7R8W7D9_9CRUS|nr:unnamed protein product [Cyprideis torosa]CAG0887472.1 unnamed protein product [Cyprideis torosa]
MVTWERGLLTKGDSLCHGVAGNAFAFLWLYQTTLDEMWLQRARRFAGFIIKRTPDTITDPPECPFSLYGGIAGVQLFLIHLNQPLKAVFPALQLAPLEVLRAETYATVSFVAARATGKAVWTVRLEPPDTEDESGSGGRSGRRRVSSSSTGGGGEESSTRSSPDSAILSAVASRLKHQTRFRGRQKVAKVFFV